MLLLLFLLLFGGGYENVISFAFDAVLISIYIAVATDSAIAAIVHASVLYCVSNSTAVAVSIIVDIAVSTAVECCCCC